MAALIHGQMVFSIKSKKIPIILQVGVELDIFANDLSFDRQFVSTADFIAAVFTNYEDEGDCRKI